MTDLGRELGITRQAVHDCSGGGAGEWEVRSCLTSTPS